MSGLVNYLDEVRARPEAARRRLLWIWTISIMLVIVLVWLLNLYITNGWDFNQAGSVATTTPATTGWWQESRQTWYSVRAGISEGWQVIKQK